MTGGLGGWHISHLEVQGHAARRSPRRSRPGLGVRGRGDAAERRALRDASILARAERAPAWLVDPRLMRSLYHPLMMQFGGCWNAKSTVSLGRGQTVQRCLAERMRRIDARSGEGKMRLKASSWS